MSAPSTDWRTLLAAVILTLFPMPGLEAAQKYTEWTGWRTTDDPLIQWRTRTQDWGKNMAPVCEFEIRIDGAAATNFRYDLFYRPEGEGAGNGHSGTTVYGRTRDEDLRDIIGACREVTDIRITRVVRRTVAPSTQTRMSAPSAGDPRPAGRTAAPPNATSSEPLKHEIPDVIRFPGPKKPYRGPQLNDVRLDSGSLRSIRLTSDRLQKALLDWRPVRVWAGGRAATISQADWDSLARITARVDKNTMRDLAAGAERQADHYAPRTKLQQFWRSMADFYRHQIAK